jgi:AraC-like DNA-binding protein
VEQLVRRFELDVAALSDVDGRVPLATVKRMWEELPALCGDPDMVVGLSRMVAGVEPSSLSGHLFLSSPTFGAALRRTIRYARILYDVGAPKIELRVDGEQADLIVWTDPVEVGLTPAAVLLELLEVRSFARRCTGKDLPIVRTWTRYPRPADERPYREAFGAPVEFEAPIDRLSFPAASLDWPQITASASLDSVLEGYARRMVDALPRGSALLGQVREAVRTSLGDGGATLPQLARGLGMSERTLQRRLDEEGLSVRQIVDEVRRELALAYLDEKTFSIAEIAFALAFSDQAAFHRAFVRWTSRTPGEYRRRQPHL